jgi:hypothetical protein
MAEIIFKPWRALLLGRKMQYRGGSVLYMNFMRQLTANLLHAISTLGRMDTLD